MRKLMILATAVLLASCGNSGNIKVKRTVNSDSSSNNVANPTTSETAESGGRGSSMRTITIEKRDPYYGSLYSVTVRQESNCAAVSENIVCAQKVEQVACNPSVYGCYPGQTYSQTKTYSYYNECSMHADGATRVSDGPCYIN